MIKLGLVNMAHYNSLSQAQESLAIMDQADLLFNKFTKQPYLIFAFLIVIEINKIFQ